MATKKDLENEVQPAEDARDAEIERLKKELAESQRRVVYATPEQDRQRIIQECEDCDKEGKDPWKVKVQMRIPRRPPTEDPWYWININNQSVQIPADDQIHEVKLPWAVALTDMLTAEERARKYADNLRVKDPRTDPI